MPIEEEVLNTHPENQEETQDQSAIENELNNDHGEHKGDREPPLNTPVEEQGGIVENTLTDTVEDTISDTVDDTVEDDPMDWASNDPELAAALAGEMEVEESEDDPMDDLIDDNPEPPKESPQETIAKATGESKRNLENLDRLAGIALDWADGFKANMCSQMSGEQAAIFAADQKQTKALIEAGKELLNTMEVKAPTPAGTFALAFIMWGIAPFATAFAFKKKWIPSVDPVYKEQEKGEQPKKDNSKYKDLKEVKQGRKVFDVFKDKGTYRTTPKGAFAKKSVSNERPSPVILDMIQDGKTNEEIREVLYG